MLMVTAVVGVAMAFWWLLRRRRRRPRKGYVTAVRAQIRCSPSTSSWYLQLVLVHLLKTCVAKYVGALRRWSSSCEETTDAAVAGEQKCTWSFFRLAPQQHIEWRTGRTSRKTCRPFEISGGRRVPLYPGFHDGDLVTCAFSSL